MNAKKESISIDVDSHTHLGQLTVWNTGEAELDCLEVRTQSRHHEHRDLISFDDLFKAVQDLHVMIHGR